MAVYLRITVFCLKNMMYKNKTHPKYEYKGWEKKIRIANQSY